MHDLEIPETLAEVPGEPGRLFSLRGGCRNQHIFWRMQEQWTRASLIYFTADVLSVLWPLSWGQQFRKWRGSSTWLCHIHLFNWSDLICNGACKLGTSPEWQLLFSSVGSSPGSELHESFSVHLSSASLAFPLFIFPLCLQDYLSSSLQQLKFNYPLLHDLMVFHLFYLRKFCSRIWF